MGHLRSVWSKRGQRGQRGRSPATDRRSGRDECSRDYNSLPRNVCSSSIPTLREFRSGPACEGRLSAEPRRNTECQKSFNSSLGWLSGRLTGISWALAVSSRCASSVPCSATQRNLIVNNARRPSWILLKTLQNKLYLLISLSDWIALIMRSVEPQGLWGSVEWTRDNSEMQEVLRGKKIIAQLPLHDHDVHAVYYAYSLLLFLGISGVEVNTGKS